jgi:hypothetical protein
MHKHIDLDIVIDIAQTHLKNISVVILTIEFFYIDIVIGNLIFCIDSQPWCEVT